MSKILTADEARILSCLVSEKDVLIHKIMKGIREAAEAGASHTFTKYSYLFTSPIMAKKVLDEIESLGYNITIDPRGTIAISWLVSEVKH